MRTVSISASPWRNGTILSFEGVVVAQGILPAVMASTPPIDPRSQAVIEGIEAIDPELVLHLPSSTLKAVVGHFLGQSSRCTFPIPREEEGVGILSGLV